MRRPLLKKPPNDKEIALTCEANVTCKEPSSFDSGDYCFPWGPAFRFWVHFGCLLGFLGSTFGSQVAPIGTSVGSLGGFLGVLGSLLGALGSLVGPIWVSVG